MKVGGVFLLAASLVIASARFGGSEVQAPRSRRAPSSTAGPTEAADSPSCFEATIDAAMKALCDEQGWGHWYFQGRCLTNAETVGLSTEDAQGLIRPTSGSCLTQAARHVAERALLGGTASSTTGALTRSSRTPSLADLGTRSSIALPWPPGQAHEGGQPGYRETPTGSFPRLERAGAAHELPHRLEPLRRHRDPVG